MVFTALTNDELYDINGGCWLCKLGGALVCIGGICIAFMASGIMIFVGVVIAVVGGIYALIA